ncbi:unnamed protein product [Schistosoma turkestanicum]|nr:unnamed protein product [Schistosoma turkestanicum]CAH8469775.1 unnamed protein product [Schistosoma turkestanicum]
MCVVLQSNMPEEMKSFAVWLVRGAFADYPNIEERTKHIEDKFTKKTREQSVDPSYYRCVIPKKSSDLYKYLLELKPVENHLMITMMLEDRVVFVGDVRIVLPSE